jgi:hypothetical protein
MRTPDDLKAAMNDLVRSTEPLPSATVLRAAKRYRTRRRLFAAGAVAVAVLAVGLGIGALDLGAGARNSRPAADAVPGDPVNQLRQSLAGLQAGDYTFSRTGVYLLSDVTNGLVAEPGGFRLEHRDNISIMGVGSRTYLLYKGAGVRQLATYKQVSLQNATTAAQRHQVEATFAPFEGAHWVRADAQQLAAAAAVDEQSSLDSTAQLPTARHPDVTGAGALISAVVDARRSGAVITGTLDGTKVGAGSRLLFDDPVSLYGPKAKAMAYRAVLDAEGRLTELTVAPGAFASQAPGGGPDRPVVIKIFNYGETATPTAPTTSLTLNADNYYFLSRDLD